MEQKVEINEAVDAVAKNFIEEICRSDEFQHKIKEQLEKSMNDAVKEALRWEPVSEQIKAIVQKALQFDPETLAVPAYNELLMEHILKSFAGVLHKETKDYFENELARLLPTQPAETTLSELIDMYIEAKREPEDLQGAITLHIEKSEYGSRFIYFDFEEDVSKYACEYKLFVDEEKHLIRSFTADGQKNEKLLTNFRYLSDFDIKLFNLYAAKTKFIVDEDLCSTEYDFY